MGIGETVADVPGLLCAEDEEKLYELASETEGPILDIGTYRGRSAAAGVRRDLEVLERVVPHDGLLLFHDFADPRNADPSVPEIGVHDAIRASWVERDCEFLGEHGACGLYRRTRGGPPGASVPVVDARSLESPRMQSLQRLRWPAGRLVRRLRGR